MHDSPPSNAAFRDEDARLAQILDRAPAAIFVKDLEGRYIYVNQEFERIREVRVDQIVGMLDREVFPADAEARRRNDRRVVDERRALEFEEVVQTASGARTYLSHKFPLLDAEGRPRAVCGIATDITRRKRLEDALRAAALAVSAEEGAGVFGELARELGRILEVDAVMIAVFVEGDPSRMRTLAAQLDGRSLRNFEYALEGSPCRTVVGKAFRFVPSGVRGEFPPRTLFAVKGMDSYAALPLNDANGRPLGLIAAMDRAPMQDAALAEAMLKIFAVRAVAEIERAHSEASYRAIFEASEDAVFVHDWDSGRIVDVNAKACEMYGYTREEFRRIGVDDISAGTPPFTAAEAFAHIERAKQAGPVRFEWHRRNRDGSLHWDEVCLKPARIAGVPRVLAFTREITERKAAEEALRSREEQYRAIFDGSADAMVLWNRDLRIVDVNAAFTQMYGYARDEMLGASFGDRIPKDGVERRVALIRRALAGEEGQLEDVTVRKDGDTFLVELRYLPIRYRDAPHVLAVARDITERRRAEEERARLEAQLLQAQKMEAIGQLTGGIAHDFNNILTSVLGYTVLALERAEHAGDATQVRYLEQMRRASQRARDVVQQMLTFSRGRGGAPRALDLPPLVCESVTLLRSTMPTTIDVVTDVDRDVPRVYADPVQVEQVLINLCINARDAIGGTGGIRIGVAAAQVRDEVCASCRRAVNGEFVEVRVSDTGSGIPAHVLDRMFEPFFTTKEVGKGSGMGLSTVHGIVHQHRGHVVVATSPNGGTTFRVMLPPYTEEHAETAPEATSSVRHAKARALHGRVLVIDDDPMVADYLRDLLAGWGLDVEVELDADAAAAWLAEDSHRVDLVITDQTMPRRTGLDLARSIVALRPDLPVLLHTAFADNLDAETLSRCGVAATLRKPVDPSEFRRAVERHLPQA